MRRVSRIPVAPVAWLGPLVLILHGACTPERNEPIEPVSVHAEAPVARSVPRGLKDLSFGMTPEAVKRALTDMEVVPADIPGMPDDFFLLSAVERATNERVDLPGERFLGRTTLGSEKAACAFVFAVDGGLSKMACQLFPLKTREGHAEIQQTILKTLTKNYGLPESFPPESDIGNYPAGRPRTWTWKDDRARLELYSRVMDIGTKSEIRLTNASAEHIALVERLEQDKERKRREAEERRKAEEMNRIQDRARSFEQDL